MTRLDWLALFKVFREYSFNLRNSFHESEFILLSRIIFFPHEIILIVMLTKKVPFSPFENGRNSNTCKKRKVWLVNYTSDLVSQHPNFAPLKLRQVKFCFFLIFFLGMSLVSLAHGCNFRSLFSKLVCSMIKTRTGFPCVFLFKLEF